MKQIDAWRTEVEAVSMKSGLRDRNNNPEPLPEDWLDKLSQ